MGFRGENPPSDLPDLVSGFRNLLSTYWSSQVYQGWVGSGRVWSVGSGLGLGGQP